jgi:hypothetical protein
LTTVTQTVLLNNLVEEVMITVMLRLINPDDIESINVLKGAAATHFTVLVLLTVLLWLSLKKVETEKVLV